MENEFKNRNVAEEIFRTLDYLKKCGPSQKRNKMNKARYI